MSYILDALKKSEAERTRGVVPTLLAPRQTPLRNSLIGWIVVAALLVNAVVFAAWLYWPSTTESSHPPPSGPVGVSTAPTPASSPTPPRSSGAPSDTPAPAVVERTVPAAEPAGAPQPPSAVAEVQPSANVESKVASDGDDAAPRYRFSTHVYASDPTMRAVTLNGKRYTEGDTIDAGVRIKEITESGVVLDVDGRSVSVDVLQDWR